jgi:2',3'-cyclic-nucleotide 2'-phosphodiesterase (5'-nucleotidase family)
MLRKFVLILVLILCFFKTSAAADGNVSLIHIGDLHGHLLPRPDMREDTGPGGYLVGGVAYVYDQIKKIRSNHPESLLVNTGDTIQGSAEALYTQGEAMVKILNHFKIDAFAPGNWDFLYGTERFIQLFVGYPGIEPLANWNALSANLYYSHLYDYPASPYADKASNLVLPPYIIKNINNVKVGIVGLTADRGPKSVNPRVVEGFDYTPGEDELAELVPYLRDHHQVDLLVLISERGLTNNILIADRVPGIDVILSSDMHEETWQAIETESGVVIVEEGTDGTMVGEMHLSIKDKNIDSWIFIAHHITTTNNKPDPEIARMVTEVRSTFVTGNQFVPHVNPMSGAVLRTPIDTVIGKTKTGLHRSNYTSAKKTPAVIEGSSHNFLADAFRAACRSDIGMIRGFRYGTHIAPGPIRLEDIYHYIPIGPQIACGKISGDSIKMMLEHSANGVFSPWVGDWDGGWLPGMSGVTYSLDPYQEKYLRVSDLKIGGERYDPQKMYSVAGYWGYDNPRKINLQKVFEVRVLRSRDNDVLDATDIVSYYLSVMPNKTVNPKSGRVNLLQPLPGAIKINNNQEIQPLKGAPGFFNRITHENGVTH